MSGNVAKNRAAAAQDIERHINLVQPRRSAQTAAPALEERERIREKIKVRATGRKVMAIQQLREKAGKKEGGAAKKESRLIPAEGGGMGMGMSLD
jgi:large subunit ribosomal protein L24e